MTKQTRIQKHLDNLSELAQANQLQYEDGIRFSVYDLQETMAKELYAIKEIQEEENVNYLFASDEMNSIKNIARNILGIETFQLAKDAKANFYNLHITDIRTALIEAYFAGVNAQEQQVFKEFPKEEHTDKLLLDGNELTKLGQRLTDVMETVELMKHAFNLVPNPRDLERGSITTYYMGAYGLLNASVDNLLTIIDELDNVSYLLLENDNQDIEVTHK